MLVNIHILKKNILLFCFLAAGYVVQAEHRTIVIIKDSESTFVNDLERDLKEELTALLQPQFEINYVSFSGSDSLERIHEKMTSVYMDVNVDLVIALGVKSSKIMHSKKEHAIPSIATMVVEMADSLQPKAPNYVFFNLSQIISSSARYFSDLYQLKRIGVLIDQPLLLKTLTHLSDSTYSVEAISSDTTELNENINGVLFLAPMFHSDEQVQSVILKTNEMGIPTFSLYNRYLSLGCTGSVNNVFTSFLKKTAIHSLHFFERKNVTQLPTEVNFKFRPVLNMESIRMIKKLPELEYFEDAIIINVTKGDDANELSLSRAVAIGLKEKISFKKEVLGEKKAYHDLQQAKGRLGPKMSVGAQSTWLSNNLVEASLGQKGELTVSGNLSLTQVLFSETVLANIAIKKLLLKSSSVKRTQELLDGVISITHAYISVLFAQSNLILENKILNKSKLNLSLAKNKRSLGVNKTSDVNRWVSELNKGKVKFSAAQSNYKQSIYSLNEILNQPITAQYTFPQGFNIKEQFKFPEELMSPYLKNEFLTEILADFYLEETKSQAPELRQLLLSEQILDRKMKSFQRQLFLPELVGFANANDIWVLDGVIANPSLPVPAPPQDLTWNAGVGMRIPILNNRVRKTNLAKARLDKEMMSYSGQELTNRLEKNIRSQIQELRSQYLSSGYAKKSANAANDNLLEMEDAYEKGLVNIDQLLEAQTTKFTSDLLVQKTNYEIALAYLKLERLTGTIQFVKPASEQKEHFQRLEEYLLYKK